MSSKYAPPTMSISFSGSGFLGIYHLGVASCLMKNGKQFLKNIDKFGGASAGALVSTMLAIVPDNLQKSVQFTYGLAEQIRSRPLGGLTWPGRSILTTIEKYLDESLPDDAHEIASGRLYISVTDMESNRNEVISEFKTKEQLIQSLLCSSYIPLYAGTKAPKINGKKYKDGGYSDNLPDIGRGRTVLVSPFCGRQDISPLDKTGRGWFITTSANQDIQINRNNTLRCIHALFPPSRKTLKSYFNQGYNDAIRFLKSENCFEGSKLEITMYETSL